MKRRITQRMLMTLLIIVISIVNVFAQPGANPVSGIVKDESGELLIGASVSVKGTSIGAITDVNGSFNLSIPPQGILQITYLGYEPLDVKITGQKDYTIVMKETKNELDEVVVTALGIKREERGLGFNTENLSGHVLTDAQSNNWATALSGKVAGLNVLGIGAGPLGTSRISLRGDNSMNMDGNNALIVVDGVPLSSRISGTGADAYAAGSGGDVPIDFGDGINDINPDDIETVTVLKGASAAALYGSRAANGVLIITTKSGARQKKGIGVTLNTGVSIENVLKWPDYQYEYGQGTQTKDKNGSWYYSYGASEDGVSTGGTSSAFGPKFDGQQFFQYDPTPEGQSAERQLWRPYKDNIKGFWENGSTVNTSVAVESANDKSSFRTSLTWMSNKWIMPNTGFDRLTLSSSFQHKVTSKLRFSTKVNFTNRNSDNLPATGYNNQSISYFMIFQNPNVDLAWYRPIWKSGQNQIAQIHPFSSYIDNPYLIAYEMENPSNKNTFLGTTSAIYEFSRKLELMMRVNAEMSYESREQRRPYNTANYLTGYYREESIHNLETNADFLLTYRDNLSKEIGMKFSVGGNMRNNEYNRTGGSITGLVTPGVYKLSNGVTNPYLIYNVQNKQVNSLYGTANFNYGKGLYLDITGRNDWSSTLPIDNSSFFYPSVSTSMVISEWTKLPSFMNFLKARLSWAQVGNDTQPYKTAKYYTPSEFSGSATMPTTLYNADFKPEISTNIEGGLDIRTLNNRLSMDLTLYNNYTKNQILDVPLDPTTGFSRATMNAGKVRNRGIEILLKGVPVQQKNFNWNASFNWSKNWNKILELSSEMGDEDAQLIAQAGTVYYYGKVGGSMGDMYGYKLLRTPDGQVIYNESDGKTAKSQDIEYVGNAYPAWKAGLQNDFTIKNVRVSFSFDGQYGGLVYSQSHHKMSEQGKLKHTLKGRDSEDGKIVGEGVIDNGDGTYSPNTVRIYLKDYYADYYRRANVETNSFDASFVKLRDARVEYRFTKGITDKLKIEALSIAVYGRNLWMWTKFPLFDPEAAALNSSTIVPGVEIGQLPTTRSFGFNLTAKF